MGIGSNAIACVARIGALELGLREVTVGCCASNIGSAKAFLEAVFREAARRPAHFIAEGCSENLVLLASLLFV